MYMEAISELKNSVDRSDLLHMSLIIHQLQGKNKSTALSTALHSAIRNNDITVVEHLLHMGANPNELAYKSDIPLIEAYSTSKNMEMFELLIAAGADTKTPSRSGWSLAHHAIIDDQLHILQFCVEHGTSADCATDMGETLLHFAAMYGRLQCVKYLLDKGVHINQQTHEGETSLYLACSEGHFAVAQCLIDRGIDVSLIAKDGYTAEDIARRNHHMILFPLFAK